MELPNNTNIEVEAMSRYVNDAEFKVAVDYAVRISIPDNLRPHMHQTLKAALEEQARAAAAIGIVTYDKMFGGK